MAKRKKKPIKPTEINHVSMHSSSESQNKASRIFSKTFPISADGFGLHILTDIEPKKFEKMLHELSGMDESSNPAMALDLFFLWSPYEVAYNLIKSSDGLFGGTLGYINELLGHMDAWLDFPENQILCNEWESMIGKQVVLTSLNDMELLKGLEQQFLENSDITDKQERERDRRRRMKILAAYGAFSLATWLNNSVNDLTDGKEPAQSLNNIITSSMLLMRNLAQFSANKIVGDAISLQAGRSKVGKGKKNLEGISLLKSATAQKMRIKGATPTHWLVWNNIAKRLLRGEPIKIGTYSFIFDEDEATKDRKKGVIIQIDELGNEERVTWTPFEKIKFG